VRDLVEKYKETLRKEWNLLQKMRKVRHKLMSVEDHIFIAVGDGQRVPDEDAHEYYELLGDLYKLVELHRELLGEQSFLRGKMAVEEYEGRIDSGDLEEYWRVLNMWPWEVDKR